MDKRETLDVVLAFYNGAKYVEDQLTSIIKAATRSNLDWQIVVIDDGSKAEENSKLREIASRLSPKIRVEINSPNRGVIKTFERGISESQADFIMLSDQDDVWLPDKIINSILRLKHFGRTPSLVFTDLKVVDSELNTIRERMIALSKFDQARSKYHLLFSNVVAGCTIAMNRELRDLACPFPDDLPMHDHWLALCAAFGGNIAMLDEATILYRQHAQNLVGSPKQQLLRRIANFGKTLGQLKRSLYGKAKQIRSLHDRLASKNATPDQQLLPLASAFENPSLPGLFTILQSRVLNLDPLRYFLTCGAYLLISAGRRNQS